MFCSNCGEKVHPNSKFCNSCGKENVLEQKSNRVTDNNYDYRYNPNQSNEQRSTYVSPKKGMKTSTIAIITIISSVILIPLVSFLVVIAIVAVGSSWSSPNKFIQSNVTKYGIPASVHVETYDNNILTTKSMGVIIHRSDINEYLVIASYQATVENMIAPTYQVIAYKGGLHNASLLKIDSESNIVILRFITTADLQVADISDSFIYDNQLIAAVTDGYEIKFGNVLSSYNQNYYFVHQISIMPIDPTALIFNEHGDLVGFNILCGRDSNGNINNIAVSSIAILDLLFNA